jgi:hypothetical protein
VTEVEGAKAGGVSQNAGARDLMECRGSRGQVPDLAISARGATTMANTLIPVHEQKASPEEIEALDIRRRWGLTFQVIAGQFAFFAILLTVWTGQDLTYSPGWVHPMFYYNVLAGVLAVIFFIYGSYLKRGAPEF